MRGSFCFFPIPMIFLQTAAKSKQQIGFAFSVVLETTEC